MVEPATLSPPYVPASNSESTKTDHDVMCLDCEEEGAPNARNDFVCVQKMERAQWMCVDVRKMCREFERLLAMGMHRIIQGSHLKTHILETINFPDKHTIEDISNSLLNACTDFSV